MESEEKENGGDGTGRGMKRVLVLGSACVDVIIRLEHLPVTEEDIHPLGQSFSIGGCAFNVAEILRRSGADFVFVCPVGTGLYGDFVKKQLTARGYENYIEVADQENGCCYCLVEKNGERTFLSCHGAEYTFKREWMASWRDTKFDMVYICGLEVEEPTGEQLVEFLEELENRSETEVWFAPGPRVMKIEKSRLDRILALHPVLHINESEALALGTYLCGAGGKAADDKAGSEEETQPWRAAAKAICHAAGNSVIVTLGADGAYGIRHDGGEFHAEGIRVKVCDTIGAGDAHAGAVMAGVSMGQTLEEAVVSANRIAALVVSKEGAGLEEESEKETKVY